MLKVAVVGLGKMGQRHIENWAKIEDCKIVGLISHNKEKLNNLSAIYHTETATNLNDLLEKVTIDVIDICLPTYLHFPFVKQATEAKKHIICEKPLGINVEESKAMVELCQQQNVQLYVGHSLRFSSEYVDARKQVKNGVIGNPGVVRLSRKTTFPGKWYADADKSGSIILDLGVHDFDWLLWTFGDVERVMAKHVQRNTNSDNYFEYALVTLRMKDGTIAHLELSWANKELETSIELAGDKGMVVNNSKDSLPIKITTQETTYGSSYLSNNLIEDPPFLKQLRHFKDCMIEGTPPIITASEALRAVEVAEAAVQSAAAGQPIYLDSREVLL